MICQPENWWKNSLRDEAKTDVSDHGRLGGRRIVTHERRFGDKEIPI